MTGSLVRIGSQKIRIMLLTCICKNINYTCKIYNIKEEDNVKKNPGLFYWDFKLKTRWQIKK